MAMFVENENKITSMSTCIKYVATALAKTTTTTTNYTIKKKANNVK